MAKKKTSPRTLIRLTPNRLGHKIQDVRKVVVKRMAAKGMTAYGLAKAAQAAGGKLTEQTVRNYLAGASTMSHNLEAMLAALGLEVRPRE